MPSQNKVGTCVLLFSLVAMSNWAFGVDKKAAEIVAQNLDSVGTAQARAAVQSRTIQGTLSCRVLDGRAGDNWAQGSEIRTPDYAMKFEKGAWEQFVFSGCKKSSTDPYGPGQNPVESLVRNDKFVLKEGLLGGELSPAWALQNFERNRARLNYMGLRNVNGRKLLAVEYHPRGNTNMTVKLYFDPDTHHHLTSIYSVSMPGGMRPGAFNARGPEIRYTLEERFSDFQTDRGLTLPHHYDLRYTEEPDSLDPQSSSIVSYVWDMTADKILDSAEVHSEMSQ